MSFNYATFVTDLANFLVIDPADANYIQALPRIIDDAEQRIYRELDLLTTVVRDQSGVLTPNSRNFTFPQHFVVSEEINVFTPVGTQTNRIQLVPVSKEFLNSMWPNEAAANIPSIPQYYAMLTDQAILIGPPPDAAYTAEVVGTIRPTTLNASNTQTWLTLYLPDLFFAEALIIGYGYCKDFGAASDDPQSAVGWSKHYTDLWTSANTEETRKKYASQAWTSKSPSNIATPPRQ